jgi:hypothetical protein
VRALEAMSNGCVMVSEHSSDHPPFVPGHHFISGSPHNLGHLARAMLTDPRRLQAMRDEAYEFLRNELTMRPAAQMLAQLASEVADRPRPLSKPRHRQVRPRRWPQWAAGTTNLPAVDRHTFRISDESHLPLRHVLTEHRATRAPASIDAIVLATTSMQYSTEDAADLLQTLRQADDSARVVVTGEDSFTVVARSTDAVVSMDHTIGSPGERRNAALLQCDSDYVLVLDSIDRLLPGAIGHLVTALDTSDADAAYGFVITPQSTFLSALPFEKDRLLTIPYLAAASLWRRSALIELGGWARVIDDPMETSRELWRHLAQTGGHAALVPRPLVRQLVASGEACETISR